MTQVLNNWNSYYWSQIFLISGMFYSKQHKQKYWPKKAEGFKPAQVQPVPPYAYYIA